MRDSRQVAVRRTVGHVAAGLLCALLAAVAWGQDPWGDYGDAPDSAIQHFPTRYTTTNSRLGGPGVHHLTIGQEMLGVGVSGEFGATDPLDPDGLPNLVNNDGFDDGLVNLVVLPYGSPFGIPQVRLAVQIIVTVPPSAPGGPRYLNVLVDANRDQEWRNTAAYKEWVAVNTEIGIAPGTTETLIVPLDIVPDPSQPTTPPLDMWMRMTLTRTPIDETATLPLGGWDGSGAFEFGETEDYLLYYSPGPGLPGSTPGVPVVTWPPPPGCWFKVWCDPCVLKLDHCGGPGFVKVHVKVSPPGCGSVNLRGMAQDPIGPAFGLGISNGAEPGNIGPTTVTPRADGGIDIAVQINPNCDPPARLQSFGLRFKLDGFSGGSKVWAATKTCGVLIYHDYNPGGLLDFYEGMWLAWQPIPIYDPQGGEPLAYVTFGNDQPTSGTISVDRLYDLAGLAHEPGVLPVASFFDVDFDVPEDWYPGMPEVETEIVGLTLVGYTDQMLADKGIVNENILEPFKMPYYVESFFDVFAEDTEQVGQYWWLDPYRNAIEVQHPYGFSIWGFRANFPLGDMNCDGVVNNQDIDGFVLALFNAAGYAVQYPNCNILNGDFTGDGHVNNQDIDGFVAALFGH